MHNTPKSIVNGWEIYEPRIITHTSFFNLCAKRVNAPARGIDGDFYLLRTVDWVNIIPITENQEVVCIRQVRPAIEEFALETPGGMIDPEDATPLTAATRELLEETGYTAARFESLGWACPNTALFDNRCHFFLAEGAKRVQDQALEAGEDIAVELIPLADIARLIEEHKIKHGLVISAFFRFFLRRGLVSFDHHK